MSSRGPLAPSIQRGAAACGAAAPERVGPSSDSAGRNALDAAFHGRAARAEGVDDEGEGKGAALPPAAARVAAATAAVRRGSACRQLCAIEGATAGEAAVAGVVAAPAAVGVVDVKGY